MCYILIFDPTTFTYGRFLSSESTLVNLQKDLLKFGSTHQVWDSLQSTVSDVKKGIIKARLLTGAYM
jgi:hypothetical protein